jgi:hypothetical protein
MDAGRVLHADLELLDRQLRDRDGRLCGKVDDLELTRAESGTIYVTALLSGPGTLWRRLGAERLGRWLEQFRREQAASGHAATDEPEASDPGRISIGLVHRIGPVIDLAVSADDLASSESERWVRDHVIGRIPGSRHEAE